MREEEEEEEEKEGGRRKKEEGFAGLKRNDFCWLLGASKGASFMIF